MGFPARSADRNVRSPLILLKRLLAGLSGTKFFGFLLLWFLLYRLRTLIFKGLEARSRFVA